MHKALSSFLIALSIYLLIITAVLYAYTQYRTKLSEVTTDKSQVVAFDVISAAASKPTTIKKPKPPKESKPEKKPEFNKKPEPKKKPVSKVAKQETKKPQKSLLSKTIKKEPIIKKTPVVSLEKPTPAPSHQNIAPMAEKTVQRMISAPVIIHKDPTKALALKHIPQPIPTQITKPIKKPTRKPTKQKAKKKKENTRQHQARQKRRSRSTKSKKGNGTHKKRSSRKGKRSFLSKLKAKINRNKHYPRIAERRGVTGSVHVRFTILKNGGVGALSASGPALLRSAAKAAVRHAFPINPAKAPFSLPYRTGVTLRYIRQ